MLALACLHQGVKPRKGVFAALSGALQTPLTTDPALATRYTVLVAHHGVASAMRAAAFAFERGSGVPQSALRAQMWYRKAIGAAARPSDEVTDEAEEEGERLLGGDATEEQVLSALAHLYEVGGSDLAPDARLARQFEFLARSSRRRDEAAHEAEDGHSSGSETSR